MLCKKCGADLQEDAKICEVCGASVEVEEPVAEVQAETVTEDTEEGIPAVFDTTPEPEKPAKGKKWIALAIIVAVVALAAIGTFAVMNRKTADPKQVVIDAFKTVNPADEVKPMEELFGWSTMADNLEKESNEIALMMKMDSTSYPELNVYAGAGLRMGIKTDVAGPTNLMNIAVLYKDMDVANLNLYAKEESLVVAIPELTGKIFTLEVDDTFGERVKKSPVIGPLLENNSMDIDGFFAYIDEQRDQLENQEETQAQTIDFKMAIDRYKEGCKAQDNFKAAMEVNEGTGASFTIDGKEEKCKGFDVVIRKDSLIDFLRTSSDFFLQDGELKEAYLKQLETSVRMSQIMGGAALEMGGSARDLMQKSYDEIELYVDQMIEYLEKSTNDVNMIVYVDKKGRLAAVEGTTVITYENTGINVEFNWELQGGTYLTQNMKGRIEATGVDNETAIFDFSQAGTYDEKNLTYEFHMNVDLIEDRINFVHKSEYSSDDGRYNISSEMTANEENVFGITAKGVVDELEKGKWIHASLDELKISAMEETNLLTLSGEFGIRPLSGEIEVPTGESMDILAATQDEWNSVMTEAVFRMMAIAVQLGLY